MINSLENRKSGFPIDYYSPFRSRTDDFSAPPEGAEPLFRSRDFPC